MNIYTSAAVIDSASTGANSGAAVLAADFDVEGTMLTPSAPLPQSYSSKDMGYVNDIRAQGYNNCWTYGSLATLETSVNKRGNRVPFFSPIHMTYWGTPRSDGTGWQREYTDGGYAYISMGYLTSWSGARYDSDVPDNISFEDFAAYDAASKSVIGTNSVIYLDATDRQTIKTAIYEYGAVVGNYSCEDSKYLNSSTYAYYCNASGLSTSQLVGHCISVVGWDDNYSKSNFRTGAQPSADGAWLCKNSWGRYWGNAGYFWISYEDMYLFDTRFGYSYAVTDYQRLSDNSKIYQNEVDGATYEFGYINNMTSLLYINVFDIEEGAQVIDKINFESTSQGAKYTLLYIPLASDNTPTMDQTKWQTLSSGTVEYKGYHSIDIKDVTLPAGKAAVGVRLDNVSGSGNSIGVCEWLSSGSSYLYMPNADYGKSYFAYSSNGTRFNSMDAKDFYVDYLDDDIGGTFVIKAVAKENYTVGDANSNGEINIADATVIQRYLAQLSVPDTFDSSACDTDGDGGITVLDVTAVQRYLAMLSTAAEIGQSKW